MIQVLNRLKPLIIFRELSRHYSKMGDFAEKKTLFLNMPLDEKRSFYKTKKPVQLNEIGTIASDNDAMSGKVSLFQGDITALEIDAIVNAANNKLLGGGGVDGAIHSAAGPDLLEECRTLNGCATGCAKITGGYKLPAKYIIHTVGPIGENPGSLQSCYQTSLELMLENKLKSIAFPCISTGIYGYPNSNAAKVAIPTVKDFLKQHGNKVDRVIFTVFLDKDKEIYDELLKQYFQ